MTISNRDLIVGAINI